VTPAQVEQAYALLQTLAALMATQTAFANAQNFAIIALDGGNEQLGTATFPAAGYEAAVAAAFTTQINMLQSELTALGVTGF
jgi:hypothetical protein